MQSDVYAFVFDQKGLMAGMWGSPGLRRSRRSIDMNDSARGDLQEVLELRQGAPAKGTS